MLGYATAISAMDEHIEQPETHCREHEPATEEQSKRTSNRSRRQEIEGGVPGWDRHRGTQKETSQIGALASIQFFEGGLRRGTGVCILREGTTCLHVVMQRTRIALEGPKQR